VTRPLVLPYLFVEPLQGGRAAERLQQHDHRADRQGVDAAHQRQALHRPGEARLSRGDAMYGRRRRELDLRRRQGRHRVELPHRHRRLPQRVEELVVVEAQPGQDPLQPIGVQLRETGRDTDAVAGEVGPRQIGGPPHRIDQPRIVGFRHTPCLADSWDCGRRYPPWSSSGTHRASGSRQVPPAPHRAPASPRRIGNVRPGCLRRPVARPRGDWTTYGRVARLADLSEQGLACVCGARAVRNCVRQRAALQRVRVAARRHGLGWGALRASRSPGLPHVDGRRRFSGPLVLRSRAPSATGRADGLQPAARSRNCPKAYQPDVRPGVIRFPSAQSMTLLCRAGCPRVPGADGDRLRLCELSGGWDVVVAAALCEHITHHSPSRTDRACHGTHLLPRTGRTDPGNDKDPDRS
jgi:hypothetical protein